MNSKSSRPKCRHCGKPFSPDYRNRYHQNYCPDAHCRRVSKTASQRLWLRQVENRDHFRGPEQTLRVQQWRKSNPGYWKKKSTIPRRSQAAELQPDERAQKSCNTPDGFAGPLQDVCLAQNPLFVGLLSVISGSTLQEDIVATMSELVIHGRKILGLKSSDKCDLNRCPEHDSQTRPTAEALAADLGQLRLGRHQHVKRKGDDYQQSFLPGLTLHD